MAKDSKFGAAFKSARASGKKEFSFNGKKYNTKTSDDTKKTPVPADKPKASESTGPKTRPRNQAADKNKTVTAKSTEAPAKAAPKKESPMAIETGSKARNQEKARLAARPGTQPRVTKKK